MPRLILSLLLLSLGLAGCAGRPAGPARVAEVSSEFRTCTGEAKASWLVDLMAGNKDPNATVEFALEQLVEGGARERVKGYVEARRAGKYPDTGAMAAAAFDDCMARTGRTDYARARLAGCFREQEVLFDAMQLRFYEKLSPEEAAAVLVVRLEARAVERQQTIRRLVRDSYQVLRATADAQAFAQAEFELCMTTPDYTPPL